MKYSDKDIKYGILNRDEKILNYFILRFKPYIMKICTSVLVNETHMCEDLAHDVILKIISKIEKYNENMKFKSWLSKLANNHFIDYHRKLNAKTKNRKRVKLSKKIMNYFIEVNQLKHLSREEEISSNDYRQDVAECIRQSIDKLKEAMNTDTLIFELRFIHNMSYEDIECQVNIKKSKAKVMLYEEKRVIRLYTEECLKNIGACLDEDMPQEYS